MCIRDSKGTDALWRTFIASVNSISPGENIDFEIVRDGNIIPLKIATVLRPAD